MYDEIDELEFICTECPEDIWKQLPNGNTDGNVIVKGDLIFVKNVSENCRGYAMAHKCKNSKDFDKYMKYYAKLREMNEELAQYKNNDKN